MSYSTLLFEKSDGVATITLNRPDKSNAFNDAMIADMIDVMKTVERDADVRAIVIAAAGKNFCAGQDLSAFQDAYNNPHGVSFAAHLRRTYNILIPKMRALEKPIIAAINGAVAGAGLGFACACDLRHASETAKFRMAFVGIGLAPDSGTSYLLPRLIGFGRATEMAFTNEPVDAQRALEYGLVNRVFSAEELMPQTLAFAKKIAQMPTRAIGLTKRALNKSMSADFESALENEGLLQEIAGHSEDHIEGVKAFVEKRAPMFKGK
ncbi:MAG: enoyl-CoA hydratase/isomerase family protein [Chloroflexi bacterium]|nr:enoyl-CoA hydratase/isomerase family protein [Chloroflexota bacterium]